MIGPILTALVTPLTNWFTTRQKLNAAKLETKLKIEANKQRLAMDTQTNNHSWEMANLTDKDKILRWGSFILFTAPFIVALFAPHHIELYFQHSLAPIPEWWKKTYMAMVGGIWGISSLKNIVPAIVDQVFKKK